MGFNSGFKELRDTGRNPSLPNTNFCGVVLDSISNLFTRCKNILEIAFCDLFVYFWKMSSNLINNFKHDLK